jgi:hypothetical protein
VKGDELQDAAGIVLTSTSCGCYSEKIMEDEKIRQEACLSSRAFISVRT